MYAQSSAREADAAGGDSERAQEARDKKREVMANVWKGLAEKQLILPEVAIAAARALLPPESSGVDETACLCSACGESGAPVARTWCLQGTPVPAVDGDWLGGCNPEWKVQLKLLRRHAALPATPGRGGPWAHRLGEGQSLDCPRGVRRHAALPAARTRRQQAAPRLGGVTAAARTRRQQAAPRLAGVTAVPRSHRHCAAPQLGEPSVRWQHEVLTRDGGGRPLQAAAHRQ
ncbi:hypothetical protein T492DRAFT_970747 [Pavlovales sp. CCMP2436]|nr:hypothetical protein T492DRAFT_970747 [Pavlovales sp. CCMP2436]